MNRCVESILNQTLREIEVVLVDDGSPVECPGMCDEWAARDNRIRVVHQTNGGLRKATLNGLKTVSPLAEYIGFVDSDDWVELQYALGGEKI